MNHQKTRFQRLFDNLNWNAVAGAIAGGAAFLGLIALLIWVLVSMSSCQKERSFTAPKGVIESDHHLKPAEGWNLTKRDYVPQEANRGKGKGRGKPEPKPEDTTGTDPQDTTYNPPPTYNGQGVILLDFDGQYVTGTTWNVNGGFYCKPSNQTPEEQAAILQRVQADYAEFGVIVTTDSTLHHAASPYKRQRVIITESWEWFGQAGGVAYVGSFTWGDSTPAFVFNSLLGYNVKYVSDAASHEAGHTLNLRHQSRYENGVKVEEYNSTIAADGKGYLMGYPYDKISGWQTGTSSTGYIQDDRAIIKNTLNQ